MGDEEIQARFIDPLDVLSLRGNQLFGAAGSYGDTLMPPLPSVAAGALRTLILGTAGISLQAFAAGEETHPAVGSASEPGSFGIHRFGLAILHDAGKKAEALHQLPADYVVHPSNETAGYTLKRMTPQVLLNGSHGEAGVLTSCRLPALAGLQSSANSKALSGAFVTCVGMQKYCDGGVIEEADLVFAEQLWRQELRVGIGLSSDSRAAEDGKLFSYQASSFNKKLRLEGGSVGSVGLYAMVHDSDGSLPQHGALRFGGDARAAVIHPAELTQPKADFEAIVRAGRCKMIMHSAGIFPGGALPPVQTEAAAVAKEQPPAFYGRVQAASVRGPIVLSGFDMARHQPKPAQRAVAAGTVYWIDQLDTTVEILQRVQQNGCWPGLPGGLAKADRFRQAEGFNQVMFAAY